MDILKRVLDGKLYDVLPYQFHEERGAGGEYIPLRNRRPSVRYAFCRIVVEDSVSLLFSEGHFPTIDCADRNVRTALADIVKETRLNLTMTEAAMRGVDRFCRDPYARPAWAHVLRRSGYDISDAGMGSGSARHSDPRHRKIQGRGRPARLEWL